MTTSMKSGIVLIRGGMGIDEPTTDLPETIAGLLEVDSSVPLRNRGLVADCVRVFDLDYYIPRELIYYTDAEVYVLAHPKFGPMYENLKGRIFDAYPMEAANWDRIRVQRIDAHGAGALWIQGVLKVFTALIGRPYEHDKRDKFMQETWSELGIQISRLPERSGPFKGQVRVSMLWDLLRSLTELHPDEIGLVCGAFGGTGPSVSAVLGDILADRKFNVVRVQLVSLPEAFMVNGHTPSDTADRLAAVIHVLQPLALYVGLGFNGIFWRFLGEHMRTIGERFSNVVQKQIAFGAAPAITVVGVPLREDFATRWLVGITALNRITAEDARNRLLMALERNLVAFETVPYKNGLGVRIRVQNPKHLKMWQWETLLPALAVARAGIGTFRLPVEVVISKGLFGKKTSTQELAVESVPDMDVILRSARVKSIQDLNEAIAFWALTWVERKMLDRCKEMTFEVAFKSISANFMQACREILTDRAEKGIFNDPLFPPQSEAYSDPLSYFMWGQVNMAEVTLADALCGYFAPVDRSEEELAAMVEAERRRQLEIMERVAEQMSYYAPEQESGS